MAGGGFGVRAGRRRRYGWLRSAGAAGTALAALTLSGGTAAAAVRPWTLVTSPDPGAQSNHLTGVSCVSSTFCMATGYYFNGTLWQTLVLKWNGAKWAKKSSPNPATVNYNQLYGVSCQSTSFCMAVGYYYNGAAPQTLILKWNGTVWSQVPSPNLGSTDELAGVSCPSATFCMADGWYYNGSTQQNFMLRWNGTKWATVTSPDSSSTESNELSGVSCSSSKFCMADGHYSTSIAAVLVDQTLVLKWNGKTWAKVPSPNPGTGQANDLSGVSCTSSSFCMASGDYNGGTAWKTLALKWNGTSWATLPSADPGTELNYLYGVSCNSASFCMAVGLDNFGPGYQTLIVRWNGTKWAKMSSPNPVGGVYNSLSGVGCTAASFCLAVGQDLSGAISSTLTEKWSA